MFFYEEKIGQTIEILNEQREERIYELPLVYTECGYKESNALPKVTDEWKPVDNNLCFVGLNRHFWIHTSLKTPPKKDGCRVALKINRDKSNLQCLVYLNGKMYQGMDMNHRSCMLEFDTDYDIYIYAFTDMLTLHESCSFSAWAALINDDVNELYYDMSVPYNSLSCFAKSSDEYATIVKHLGIASNMLNLCNVGDDKFLESVREADSYMKEAFYKKVCGSSSPVCVTGIGHTHIDVAWLWTYAQTREKVQRSFSIVLRLMEQYPEYKFMSSQPQLYKFLKEDAPEIYEQVKEKIREGRWEVEGGMWVEADCNLISGESMVRQFMHGKKFIKDEFGADSKILWLPDVFGYSGAMPQIMKKCGIEKFFTSKISWNETNKMPFETFYWQGIDGSEIFTHFATAQDYDIKREKTNTTQNIVTYNAKLTPCEVKGTRNRYSEKEFSDEVITTFGYGDGGGGPTDEMLENQRRMSCGIPGIPKTKIDFAGNTLERIKKSFDESCAELREVPKWCGELYLEFHRGTYTNMAKMKKYNRQSELLYQTAEAASVLDMILTGGKYNSDLLYSGWETILLNQFHDCLPGSSIKEVYDDALPMYEDVIKKGEDYLSEKLASLCGNMNTEQGLVVYNPTGFVQSGVVFDGEKNVFCRDVPAYGWKNITENESSGNITVTERTVQNERFILSLNGDAEIVSLYDKKENREFIKDAANRIRLYEDRPYQYDGWELSSYHKHKYFDITDVSDFEAFNDGVCGGFIIKRRFSNSEIIQKIIMYADSDRIDFETKVDWHENNMVLKTLFPLNIFSNKAVYDIQFGNLERPTHSNTSWDQAKFEVCGHKWADISDYNHGLSLMNNCKYGYSAKENVLSLTLLKAANFPNPEADRGINTFTYSILPHSGDFRESGTIKEAYLLNNPLRSRRAEKNSGTLPGIYSPICCNCDNIVIDTIKKAEDNDDIIIRAYEAYNCCTAAQFTFGFDIKKAYICDMLENTESELKVKDNKLTAPFSNYEVVTLRIKL